MIPNHPIGKDLLSAANLSLSDIQEVLARATALWKDDGNSAVTANSRKVIANLFFQRSTRTKLGFEVLPSAANFVFARHPAHTGESLASNLRARNILVRHFNKPRIADFLRITVGTDVQSEKLLNALGEILKK